MKQGTKDRIIAMHNDRRNHCFCLLLTEIKQSEDAALVRLAKKYKIFTTKNGFIGLKYPDKYGDRMHEKELAKARKLKGYKAIFKGDI